MTTLNFDFEYNLNDEYSDGDNLFIKKDGKEINLLELIIVVKGSYDICRAVCIGGNFPHGTILDESDYDYSFEIYAANDLKTEITKEIQTQEKWLYEDIYNRVDTNFSKEIENL